MFLSTYRWYLLNSSENNNNNSSSKANHTNGVNNNSTAKSDKLTSKFLILTKRQSIVYFFSNKKKFLKSFFSFYDCLYKSVWDSIYFLFIRSFHFLNIYFFCCSVVQLKFSNIWHFKKKNRASTHKNLKIGEP